MAKKKDGGSGGGCCQVASLVSVDERGQMILPKDIREKAGIMAGDKLALVVWEKNGAFCCLTLIKANELSGMVKEKLEPLLAGLVRTSIW
ncbi:MAG: AbrB/MazE/SpoVT family DNA-binding domain-containing protein [Acidobacteria bacterium]|jgi:AbrB family looped-hinge helix DNA binding protein|nr:AbrB/MazE/SpoVT family DNA-binding domain-containing protein [Acidobacteriota bacterium]